MRNRGCGCLSCRQTRDETPEERQAKAQEKLADLEELGYFGSGSCLSRDSLGHYHVFIPRGNNHGGRRKSRAAR